MDDRVGDVLARRAALDSGAAAGVAVSVFLHAAAAAAIVYAAMHHAAPQMARAIEINVTPMTVPTPKKAAAVPAAPVIHEPAPVIAPPKPDVNPEPKTVPLSPFGKSPKKGSETPAPVPLKPAAATTTAPAAATATAAAIPIGGTGATIEGDFPYTLYIENMKRLIGSHWFRPQVAGAVTTIVYFTIDRDGTIRDVKIETGSNNGTFDRAAERAIRETSPLPPLPFAYAGTFLGVHLTFK
jgi:TonB family protein